MRRRRLLVVCGAALLAGCSSSAGDHSAAPQSNEAVATTTAATMPSTTTTRVVVDDEGPINPAAGHAAVPASRPAVASSCRSGAPLANVYHPYRLHVVSACATVTGTVMAVRHEDDGDVHFDLAVDPSLVNAGNQEHQHGWLVAEIVPADEPGCTSGRPPRVAVGTHDYGTCTSADVTTPSIGAQVSIVGPYVLDANHGWMEIHPVWSITHG